MTPLEADSVATVWVLFVDALGGKIMGLMPKKTVSLSAIAFFFIILVAAMGWIVVLNQITAHLDNLPKLLVEIGEEVLKVAVIAAAAAIMVERLLNIPEGDPRTVLRRVGITQIFSTRLDARMEFLRSVHDEDTRRIVICGISLRDFLPISGALHEIWNAICERLLREEGLGLPAHRRLHVRLLLLLPNSDEGYFRHSVESKNNGDTDGMPFDIPNGLGCIRGAQQRIFSNLGTEFLEARLYEHCPFSFVFASDNGVFVEQYDYHDQRQPATMPLINFQKGTPQYREQVFSLDVIWENALSVDVLHESGTAVAIREARIKNVFRAEHRESLTRKQAAAVKSASTGSIDILAISGKFYTSNPIIAPQLQFSSRGNAGRKPIPIRFAIINPSSQQAILRAVADDSPPDEIGKRLRAWSWAQHRQSKLYTDTRASALTMFTWHEQRGCDVGVRLYSSSVACAILQTDSHAFVEQYMYGRSKSFQPGFPLGGEYPVIEYDVSKKSDEELVEHQIIAATFNMVWDCYSVAWEEYVKRDERGLFEQNLARILAELRIEE